MWGPRRKGRGRAHAHRHLFRHGLPPCFIGKRRLEKALAARPGPEVEIHWRAFQLNPDMPAEGMDRRAYLEAKFGGRDSAAQVYDRVKAAGAEEEIPFAFEAIKRTPNTVDLTG